MRSGRSTADSARDRLLHLEVAVLLHARELDDAAQLDLAPPAAHLRRAQRLHEPRASRGPSSFWPRPSVGQLRRELPAFLLAGSIRRPPASARPCRSALRIGSSTAWMFCWRSATSGSCQRSTWPRPDRGNVPCSHRASLRKRRRPFRPPGVLVGGEPEPPRAFRRQLARCAGRPGAPQLRSRPRATGDQVASSRRRFGG